MLSDKVKLIYGRTRGTAVPVLLAAVLGGCGSGEMPKDSSQVVARVNDKEITVTQLNQVLSRAGTAVTPELTQQAVDSLVREELLVQDALKRKLDREPAVMQAIEKTRRQVLAQAYAERELLPKVPVATSEIQTYYRSNPILFEQRKVFRMTTFLVPQSDVSAAVRGELEAAHSVDQVRAALDKHAIKYETQVVSPTSEQLPMEQLPHFEKAKVGDLLIVPHADGRQMLMSVTGIEDSPLSLERATPSIQQYLTSRRNREALEAYTARSKATSAIAYLDQRMPQPSAPPGGEVVAASKAGDISDDHIRQGAASLD